jgi:hypothetical protein
MTIGPGSTIEFEYETSYKYRIVRRYPDHIVLVALGKDNMLRWMNFFVLLARRYDPVRKEEFLYRGFGDDDRLVDDDPLTRPIAEYQNILDDHETPSSSDPWGSWNYYPYVRVRR